MYACQWQFDIPFGQQKEVLDIMRRWDSEMAKDTAAPKTHGQRVMVGHIGASPSHLVNEYVVEHVADWEKFMGLVATGRYKGFSDDVAKYIVPGSQHWVIYRIAEDSNGKK
jgi:hypothetical protein